MLLFARAWLVAAFGARGAFRSRALLAAEALAPAVLAWPPASVACRFRVRMHARFAAAVTPFGRLTVASFGVLLRPRPARSAMVPAMLALLAAALSAAFLVMALVAGALSLTTLSSALAWLPVPIVGPAAFMALTRASPVLGAACVSGVALSSPFRAFGCGSRNGRYRNIRYSGRTARTFLQRPAHKYAVMSRRRH